jgi:hypothetical protein
MKSIRLERQRLTRASISALAVEKKSARQNFTSCPPKIITLTRRLSRQFDGSFSWRRSTWLSSHLVIGADARRATATSGLSNCPKSNGACKAMACRLSPRIHIACWCSTKMLSPFISAPMGAQSASECSHTGQRQTRLALDGGRTKNSEGTISSFLMTSSPSGAAAAPRPYSALLGRIVGDHGGRELNDMSPSGNASESLEQHFIKDPAASMAWPPLVTISAAGELAARSFVAGGSSSREPPVGGT